MTPEAFHAKILELLAAKTFQPAAAPEGLELDLPANVQRGLAWLATQPQPTEGSASDTLYRQAAWLKDYGLSHSVVLELIAAHSPGYLDDDIATRVSNAFKHGQNEIGAHARPGMLIEAAKTWLAEHPEMTPAPRVPLTLKPKRWLDIRDATYKKPWWWWQDRCIGDDSNLYTGRAKAGKTTLLLNLAVAVAGGIDLLGKETRRGAACLLVGEDRYGEVRDSIRLIAQTLGTDDDSLQSHLSMLSIRSDRVAGGHKLIDIADDGLVNHSDFLREVILPHLGTLPKPCLFVIDPLAVFVGFNRYSDVAARALVDGWCNDLVDLGVTPLITDHPSQASLDDGRNVAGSMQLAASFPLVATLKADRWQGPQRKMTFELMGSRYAPEDEGEAIFYRRKDSPAFALDPAPGFAQPDLMLAVVTLIRDLLAREWPIYCTDRNRKDYGMGTNMRGLKEMVAELRDRGIIIDEVGLTQVIAACGRQNWLMKYTTKGGGTEPSHLRPGNSAPKLDALMW